MPKITIAIEDCGQYLRQLGVRANAAVQRGLLSGVLRAKTTVVAATDQKKAVDSGAFKRAWKHAKTQNGVMLYNDRPYSAVLEYGRRPGKGVSEEGQKMLAKWAMRKLGVSKKESKGVAFVIARAIKKRGLPARRIMADVLPKIENDIIAEVLRELEAEISR